MKKAFFLLAVSLFLFSCQTPYHKKGWSGGSGYTEFPLGKDSAKIIFTGNTNTSKESVEKYLFYRCAEYTLGKHYSFFEILEKNMDVEEKVYHYPGEERTTKSIEYGKEVTRTTYEPPRTEIQEYYKASFTIKLHKGKPESIQPNIYDAYELRKSLEPYIKRKFI